MMMMMMRRRAIGGETMLPWDDEKNVHRATRDIHTRTRTRTQSNDDVWTFYCK